MHRRQRRSEAPKGDESNIDLGEAQRFLDLLGAEGCSFQTYDDRKEKNPKLARILHGTLDEHSDALVDLNRRGACIAASVNKTDLQGAAKANILEIRALFADLDGAPLDAVKACKLRPHIVVESSPGRHHAYWRVEGVPLDEYEDLQRAVAKAFDGDPAVALLTTRARLPGFIHHKNEPFRVRLVDWAAHDPFNTDEVLVEWPPLKKAHAAPKSMVGRIVLPIGVPLATAAKFYEMRYLPDGERGLHYYRGEFYEWQGTHYQSRDPDALRHALYAFLVDCLVINKEGQPEPFNPRAGKVSEILDALKAGAFQDERRDLPLWLGEDFVDYLSEGWLACKNGLLDLTDREQYAHTPSYFNVVGLPYDYDPEAKPPKRWLKFLSELWSDDPECRQLLSEIFGYVLTADNSQQKIFLVVGPTRSGKGTIRSVLTSLLGLDNVVNPTLASLAGEFGLQPWINKRLAIISDARLGARNVSVVIERLLSISGEDPLTVNRKYLAPWTGKLGTRILILTNELPRFLDAAKALAGRFVILTLKNSFYGKEDPQLSAKLIKELPGILNMSLDGLDRLRTRGCFEMPKSSEEAVRMMTDLASPVSAFVRDWCEVGNDKKVRRKELFGAFKKWCDLEGYHRAGSAEGFGRNLKAAYPQIDTNGKLHGEHAYVGIDLTEKAREELAAEPEPGWRG